VRAYGVQPGRAAGHAPGPPAARPIHRAHHRVGTPGEWRGWGAGHQVLSHWKLVYRLDLAAGALGGGPSRWMT
jgi:hypothetical protein